MKNEQPYHDKECFFNIFYQSNKVLKKVFELKCVRPGVQSKGRTTFLEKDSEICCLITIFRSLLWRLGLRSYRFELR